MGGCIKLHIRILVFCNIILIIGFCESTSAFQSHGPQTAKDNKPHIVIILADDMGFNDVSIHGSNQIPTPNIDALGILGIQLNNFYVAPQCTPSRTALMTGKYPSNLGMQGLIGSERPYGLDLEQTTIAEYMKAGGYGTHLIGKWHLGFYRKAYTPMFRGFDSHFGFYTGSTRYYTHGAPDALNMRNNLDPSWETVGQYATDLFTEKALHIIQTHNKSMPMFMILSHLAPHGPIEAPQEEIDKFDYIEDPRRRVFAAMMSKLDESVGKVVQTLEDSDMLGNTIILFMSDNGAPVIDPTANSGSNYPFRGQKSSGWEGGVRSAAAIWSPRLQSRQRVSRQMIHMTDWLPTFTKIAGVEVDGDIDGIDVWDSLSYDLPSPRDGVLVHYDNYMGYINKNFKLISGRASAYDTWVSGPIDPTEQNATFGENYSDALLSSNAGHALLKYSKSEGNRLQHEINEIRLKAQITCNKSTPPDSGSPQECSLAVAPCLFDILNDPCETTNLAPDFPNIVAELQAKLDYYGSIALPRIAPPSDPRSNPANFGNIWTWWYDELDLNISNVANWLRQPPNVTLSLIILTTLILYKNIQIE